MRIRIAIVTLVAGCVLSSGSVAMAAVPRGIGLGSTPAQWKATYTSSHGKSNCQSGNACYGVPLSNNSSGPTFLFTTVLFSGGRADTYTINLWNNSKLATAMHSLMYTMPADIKMGPIKLEHAGPGSSCGIGYGTSKALGKRFKGQSGGSEITVEMYGETPGGVVQYYRATDIQTIVVSIGHAPFSGIC